MIRRVNSFNSHSVSKQTQIRILESKLRRLKKEADNDIIDRMTDLALNLVDGGRVLKSGDNFVKVISNDLPSLRVSDIEDLIDEDSDFIPLAASVSLDGDKIIMKLWGSDAGVVDLYQSSTSLDDLLNNRADDVAYSNLYYDLSVYAALTDWSLRDAVSDIKRS